MALRIRIDSGCCELWGVSHERDGIGGGVRPTIAQRVLWMSALGSASGAGIQRRTEANRWCRGPDRSPKTLRHSRYPRDLTYA